MGNEAKDPVGKQSEVTETQVPAAQQAAKQEPGKPCERLTLVVEFAEPMDRAGLGELLDAVKLYGAVVKANHEVLRRSKRALV